MKAKPSAGDGMTRARRYPAHGIPLQDGNPPEMDI